MSPKIEVGNKGRINRNKGILKKGYTARWTEEVFTVTEVCYTNPITYKIVDYNKEGIKGSLYEQELQQEDQHPLTGQRAANFRRDLEAT